MSKPLEWRDLSLLVVLLALGVFFGLLAPQYLSARNLSMLTIEFAITSVLSLGMLLVILPGHIDLSAGSGVCPGAAGGQLLERPGDGAARGGGGGLGDKGRGALHGVGGQRDGGSRWGRGLEGGHGSALQGEGDGDGGGVGGHEEGRGSESGRAQFPGGPCGSGHALFVGGGPRGPRIGGDCGAVGRARKRTSQPVLWPWTKSSQGFARWG